MQVVQHKRSKKYFILLEDGIGSKVRVVNPHGDVVLLDEEDFDPDYLDVKDEGLAFDLSEAQIEAGRRFLASLAEQEAVAAQAQAERKKSIEASSHWKNQGSNQAYGLTDRKKSISGIGSRKPNLKSSKKPNRRFAQELKWSSSSLSFYKHKIEPLGPKDVFIITVYDEGDFRFTREAFESNFTDVLMSSKYRETGVFSYPQIPDKALKFKVAES